MSCETASREFDGLPPCRDPERAEACEGFPEGRSRPSGRTDESRDRGTEVGLGGIPELGDQWVAVERLLHDAALDPFAAPVDQTHFREAGFVRGPHVLLDDRLDVTRSERMEVQDRLDRDVVRVVDSQRATSEHQRPEPRRFDRVSCYAAPAYDAVTTVLIPPRTLKSPMTVMRRGWQAATRSSRIWLVTAS